MESEIRTFGTWQTRRVARPKREKKRGRGKRDAKMGTNGAAAAAAAVDGGPSVTAAVWAGDGDGDEEKGNQKSEPLARVRVEDFGRVLDCNCVCLPGPRQTGNEAEKNELKRERSV